MESPVPVLIKNGLVVSSTGTQLGDVLMADGRVAAVGPSLHHPDAVAIDATGQFVMPGLIDIHVHFRDPGGTYKEDFASGTRAALAGGFTTIVDMPNTSPPTASRDALVTKETIAAEKAYCDYGFWFGATPDNVREAATVGTEFGLPVVGLKLYMGSSTGSLLVDDTDPMYRHFATFPRNRLLAVHAEDESVMRLFASLPGNAHNRHRPPLAAALAVTRALHMAHHLGRRIHIAHLSTGAELSEVILARERGTHVTCEVAPHHLYLTEADQERWGSRGKVNPPLRSSDDVESLWAGLQHIDIIATDHAPHTIEEKNAEYQTAPSGLPGLETSLGLMYQGVRAGRLTIERLVHMMSTGPADLISARTKGRIDVGADADIVLFDPQQRWTVEGDRLETRSAWSPWEGTTITGKVSRVFLRGQEMVRDGGVCAVAGTGRPLSLTLPSELGTPPGR